MFEIINSIILPIIKYTNAAVSGSANIRSGFVFDKEDLEMAKPEDIAKIDSNKINQPISNAELHIMKLNKKVPLFGHLVDVLFSPNTLKVLTLLSAAALIFSPLGPYVAVAGISLTLGMIAVTTAMQIYSTKNRQENQLKSSILKESVKEHEKLQTRQKDCTSKIYANHPQLYDKMMQTTFFNKNSQNLRQQTWGEQSAPKSSFLKSAGWGIGLKMPTMIFSLVISIVTLNPISIALSAVSLILGSSSAAAEANKQTKANDQFHSNMTDARNKLGLPGNIKDATLTYSDNLSELKRTNRAMERFENDYEKNAATLQKNGMLSDDNLAKLFKTEYLNKEPFIKFEHPKITYLSAAKDMFVSDSTWSSAKTSACLDNPKYDHHFNDQAHHNGIVNKNHEHQPDVDKFVANVRSPNMKNDLNIGGINYTHHHAEDIRNQEHATNKILTH